MKRLYVMIQIKRAYDEPSEDDGARVLVDRMWPRGISKEDLNYDKWLKGLAPSNDLRKWYDHDADKFEEFSKRYKKELEDHQEQVDKLISLHKDHSKLTLIYAAKDEEHNNAAVLKEYLKENM